MYVIASRAHRSTSGCSLSPPNHSVFIRPSAPIRARRRMRAALEPSEGARHVTIRPRSLGVRPWSSADRVNSSHVGTPAPSCEKSAAVIHRLALGPASGAKRSRNTSITVDFPTLFSPTSRDSGALIGTRQSMPRNPLAVTALTNMLTPLKDRSPQGSPWSLVPTTPTRASCPFLHVRAFGSGRLRAQTGDTERSVRGAAHSSSALGPWSCSRRAIVERADARGHGGSPVPRSLRAAMAPDDI